MIDLIKQNLKKIVLVIIILVGLIISLYLVKTRQIFKPKAFTNVNEAFEVTDDQGNNLQDKCSGTTCETDSLKVNIRIKDVPALLKR